MAERTRIEASSGAVYELRPWSYEDGQLWAFRLVAAAAGALDGIGSGSDLAAAARLLTDLGEERYLELMGRVMAYTSLVQVSDGREAVVTLADVATVHMQRRQLDGAELLVAHLREEFGPFFGGLKRMLAGMGGDAAEAGEATTSKGAG